MLGRTDILVWRGRNPYQALKIFSRLLQLQHLRLERMKPLLGTKTSPDEGGNQACRSTHHRLNARWPQPIGRPPKPSPDRGKEEETNIPDQREHLPVSLQTSRNLYMKSSQTNSRTKPRRSATIRPRTSTKICCGSTVKRSGATVGDVTPGYP